MNATCTQEPLQTSYRPMMNFSRPRLMGRGGSSSRHSDHEDGNNHNKQEPLMMDNDDDDEQVYIVKQKYGYLSIAFSVVQTIVLVVMMWQCGVAPIQINPMIGPYPDALSEWGGKNAVNILDDGEWWRLLTPIFLHAGVIHLFCNIAVQLETGAFFEREWGWAMWLGIYLVSAVGSSVLSVIVMPNSISVGSSGAVMGLFGGKVAEWTCRACEHRLTPQARVGHEVRNEQCGAVACSVIVVALFSFIPYVDWAAHLGGFVAGVIFGVALFSFHHGPDTSRLCQITGMLLGAVATMVGFAVAIKYMYSGAIEPAEELRDVCGYYKEFFEDYECKCMRDEHGDNNNNRF